MKRYLHLRVPAMLLVAVLLILTLASCANNTPKDTQGTEKPTSTSAPTDAPGSDPTGDPEEEPSPEPDPDPDPDPAPVDPKSLTTVFFTTPAIPADAGEEIDLTKYNVQFTAGKTVAAKSITWDSEQLSVRDGRVSADKAGVYELIAMSDDAEKTVYLVVKAPEDTEYVLYYNSFDDDGSIDELDRVETANGASYTVSDGRLVLSASGNAGSVARVLLPQWLGDFANYSISSSATITRKANESRWMSLMYRVQNNDYPYYQMCVRANTNATNGVELAYRTADGSWAYYGKTGYSSALSANELYDINLIACEGSVSASINGQSLLNTGSAIDLGTGRVGLQASGCQAEYDYVKVTAVFPAVSTFGMENVDIKDVSTGITSAPTVIAEISSESELEGISSLKAGIAVMELNDDGFVICPDGSVICTANAAIHKLNNKAIPAFKLPDTMDAGEAAVIFMHLETKELMVLSSNADTIKTVRDARPDALGVLDWSNKTDIALIDMRSAANSCGSRICLLPADMATQATTDLLSSLSMTVWFKAEKSTNVELITLITAGANGILTDNCPALVECLGSDIFAENTIIRPVSVIGHRGMPAIAPENTIIGSQLAAKYGANIIENDIYITADGVLVVMHDGTIDRTTNGTGNVESFTYDQLCSYMVDDAPDSSATGLGTVTAAQPIPTLEEYFEAFKGTDTFLFIEIKSSDLSRLVPALAELIGEYDFYGQCGVICFSTDAVRAVKEAIPQISAGYLCSDGSFESIYSATTDLCSTYNPSYSVVNKSLVKALAHRGVTTWPWTVNSETDFDKFFLMGVGGITTNYSNFVSEYVRHITSDKQEYTLSAGGTAAAKITVEKYGAAIGATDYSNGTYVTTDTEMIVIEGNATLSFNGTQLSADEAGDATVLFRLSYQLNNGTTVYVYTQPVTVHVQ